MISTIISTTLKLLNFNSIKRRVGNMIICYLAVSIFNCIMEKTLLVKKRVPRSLKHFELPWYKRGRLMTYIDLLKSEEFLGDVETHFKNIKFVNFVIIHQKFRGDPVDPNDVHKTVRSNDLKLYVCNDRIIGSVIKSNRKDINIEKNLMKKHFNNSLQYLAKNFF